MDNVRPAAAADADALAQIYNHCVLNTPVTFEEVPVEPGDMAARVHKVQSETLPWLVVEQDGSVAGYAYATKWKDRSAYRFSVESTVYLHPGHTGKGLGTSLYRELFRLVQERGLHAVIGGIALPNAASVALHEKFGMKKVAHFAEVGHKFGRWIDVGYWERLV